MTSLLITIQFVESVLQSSSHSQQTYTYKGEYFVSFYTTLPPNPPPMREPNLRYPEQCYATPRWFDKRYPFLPFCILRPDWSGHIFGSLKGTLRTFPTSNPFDNHCELHPGLQLQWWRLERALVLAYEELLRLRPTFLHPLEIQEFRKPSSWGFTILHESEEAARIRAMNSRNAFVPLMALLAYTIALSCLPSSGPEDIDIRWIDHLVTRCGIDPEWVNSLAQSTYCSPSAPRVGVYIDWETFIYPHLLRLYFRFRIPVWIRISASLSQSPNLPSILRPRQQDIRLPAPPLLSPPSVPASNSPPSRQKPGEGIHEFIARMIRENSRRIALETPRAQMARLDRERQASRFLCPGARGAYVFQWIRHNNDDVRTYVPRHLVPKIWESFASTQKWYDSVHNEWDICAALDPYAEVVDDDFEDSDDWERPLSSQVFNARGIEAASSLRDLARGALQLAYSASQTLVADVQVPAMEDTLFRWYGFFPDGLDYPAPSTDKLLDERRVARILLEVSFTATYERRQIIDFFSFLVFQQPVPAHLHDLNDDHSTPLRLFMSRAFTSTTVSDTQYVITAPGDEINAIQVQQASLVLESFRSAECTTLDQLALHFISEGVRFYMGTSSDDPFDPVNKSHNGLGFRPMGYKPDVYDFKAYIARRDDLLKDPNVARAALLQGGIIWRLTLDSLRSIHGSVDYRAILSQATENVRLTQHDLGVIVGMYTVWTGMTILFITTREQCILQFILLYTGVALVDKELSWWPQQSQFLGSNLDLLHWTSACENWYTTRMSGIERGAFDVRSGRQWRQALTFFSQTGRLRKQVELHSQSFLRTLDHS